MDHTYQTEQNVVQVYLNKNNNVSEQMKDLFANGMGLVSADSTPGRQTPRYARSKMMNRERD